MKFLSIETSHDDSSVAIFEDFKLINEKTYSQEIHKKYGGVIPELASREHTKDLNNLISSLIEESGWSFNDLEAVAVTIGPGLINTLQVGLIVAKTISDALDIPLYSINHLEGHFYSAFIEKDPKLIPDSALVLLISGGHTILFEKNKKSIFLVSKTKDDAIGEAFDKVSRILDMNINGGKELDSLYEKIKDEYEQIPINIPLKNEYNFSFSGIKSKVSQLLASKKYSKEQILVSFVNSVTEQLRLKTMNYFEKNNHQNLIIVGGVSANNHIRNIFSKEKINLILPQKKYSTDNASMIGYCFIFLYKNNLIKPSDLDVDSNPRLSFDFEKEF